MRVIGGSRKRMPLETIKGMETRPTTDRIKETLFNMLQPEIYQCRFLELFAGSGQMGIEALSRGAREAVFVEKNPAAARCIKRNLDFTRLEETGRLYTRDVMDFLQHPGGEEPFDLIFLDPPYDKGLEEKALALLADGPLLAEDALIVVEASLQTDFSYLDDLGYEQIRQKKYKTNQHVFITRGQ